MFTVSPSAISTDRAWEFHSSNPPNDDVGDALLVQDLADPNGIEHQRARRSDVWAWSWMASMVFAASTIDWTRSGTVIRS